VRSTIRSECNVEGQTEASRRLPHCGQCSPAAGTQLLLASIILLALNGHLQGSFKSGQISFSIVIINVAEHTCAWNMNIIHILLHSIIVRLIDWKPLARHAFSCTLPIMHRNPPLSVFCIITKPIYKSKILIYPHSISAESKI
jgi:hypothetical protein